MSKLRGLFLLSILVLCSAALAQEADLFVLKTGPEQSAADTDVTYTVTVFNGGPDPATTVTLTDPIPVGMTFVSLDTTGAPGFLCTDPGVGNGGQVVCTAPTLLAGSSAVFSFVFHIDAGTPPGTFFVNIATSECSIDSTDENNSGVATTVTPFPPQSDVAVTKLGPSFAGPDTDVVYTITVRNNGPDEAATLTLDDTLPGDMTFVSLTQNSGPVLSCTTPAAGSGGTISCTGTSYPFGQTTTLTLTGHIPPGASASYSNTATVSTTTTDPNENNDEATTTLFVSATDVSVVKTGPGTAQAGNLTYTITVANAGPDTATAPQLDDPLPAGTTFVSLTQDNGPVASCFSPAVGSNGTVVCFWPSLASATSAQFTLVIHSGSNTSVVNTAFVTTQSFDTNTANDQDSVTTTVTPVADLSITKSGPATVPAGSNITYTVSVVNGGPSDATSLSLTDILAAELTFVSANAPAGWSCITPAVGANGTITCSAATLLAGTTADFTFVVHLPSSATAGGTVSNTATVSTTTLDPDGGNDSSETQGTVTAPEADLSITKSGAATIPAGSNIAYTVSVTSSGPSNASTVSVTDILAAELTFVSASAPAGWSCITPAVGANGTITCSAATLLAGTAADFTFVVHLPSSATAGGTVSNTATVSTTTLDPDGGNDSSTTDATVTAALPTDVSISKTADGGTFIVGSTVTYTIVVTNTGASDALDTVVTDTIPIGTTFLSATSTQGTCTGTTTVTCTIGTLAPSASATITLQVSLPATPETFVNAADVTISNGDTNPANDADSATILTSAQIPAIPTLSTLALALLAAAFSAAGFIALRGRM